MALKIYSVNEEETKHEFEFLAESKQDFEYIKVFISSYFLSIYGIQKSDFNDQINKTINACKLNEKYKVEYNFNEMHRIISIPRKKIDYKFKLYRCVNKDRHSNN